MRSARVLVPAVALGAIGITTALHVSDSRHKSTAAAREAHAAVMNGQVTEPVSHKTGQPLALATWDDKSRSQALVDMNSAGSSTIQQMPKAIDSPPNAASSINDDHPLTQIATVRALAGGVHELFFAEDYCRVTAGLDEHERQRCRNAGALAQQIVTVPKTPADSWAYGMEYELSRHIAELSQPDAGWELIDHKEARCNALGCVVYLEGHRWNTSFRKLLSAIRSDRSIAQLNGQRRWPGPETWDQFVNDRAMLVLPR